MSVKENKAIVRRYIHLWNTGDLAIADEIIAADFVNHSPIHGETPDREGLKQGVRGLHAGFSDLQFTIEDMVADGDRIVIRGTFWGVHTGTFEGILATGRDVTTTWFILLRIEGGKVTDRWANYDELDFLTQLDVIPPIEWLKKIAAMRKHSQFVLGDLAFRAPVDDSHPLSTDPRAIPMGEPAIDVKVG
jgi:predicted ester cyclase